jgi:tRNA pseudouridine38-40 synthase
MRLLLTLQYLGTRYAGWQTQANAVAVQSVVEEVLGRMYETPIRIEGAGRTDSGVHAIGQRAHFDAPFPIPPRGLLMGMNDLLPHDIRVTRAEEVADDFHCRFAAKSKTYAYRIWNAEVMDVFRWETHAHVAKKLDVDAMRAAAKPLVGTHDFKAFTVAEPEVSSTSRTIEAIEIVVTPSVSEGPGRADGGSMAQDARHPSTRPLAHARGDIVINVTADGFLRFMVRRIAGSLIEIGRGKLDGGAIARSLEPDFETARWTAPAKGLVLEEIRY